MPGNLISRSADTLLNYEDVRQSFGNTRPSILLGNGFSIACDPIFTYRSLYQAAVEGGLSDRAQTVFQRLGSNDFEGVMGLLEMSHWVATTYNLVRSDEQSEMLADLEIIKNALIQAIGNSHLSLPGDIREERRARAVEWLRQYSAVFTTNYDLLLYWVTMNGDRPLFDDGFRNDTCHPPNLVYSFYSGERRMYYLHGALHLYKEEGKVCKHRSGTEGLCLTDLVRDGLSRNQYPLFVAESSAENKLRQINQSLYLAGCLQQLRNLTGRLVIFGHSLGGTDEHILDAIVRSRISTLYVGLHGGRESIPNQAIRATVRRLVDRRAQRSQNTLDVHFYGSESAGLWDEVSA